MTMDIQDDNVDRRYVA